MPTIILLCIMEEEAKMRIIWKFGLKSSKKKFGKRQFSCIGQLSRSPNTQIITHPPNNAEVVRKSNFFSKIPSKIFEIFFFF